MAKPTNAELTEQVKQLTAELEAVTQERDDAYREVEMVEHDRDLAVAGHFDTHHPERAVIIDSRDQFLRDKVMPALRKPFPPNRVGILPRAYGPPENRKKANCKECGKYHDLPAVHLDYVGHGAVTERLLEVDPTWSWEPMALDSNGLPGVVKDGQMSLLWIRLTIAGVTRIGVGSAPSAKADVMKELIGDAIRNAAMRFGVALDLWIKGDGDTADAGDERTHDDAEPSAPATPVDPVVGLKIKAARMWGKEAARAAWEAVFPEDPTPDMVEEDERGLWNLLRVWMDENGQPFAQEKEQA